MTLWKCTAEFATATGLPRDRVSNTFWLSDGEPSPTPAKANTAAELVRDFFTVTPPSDFAPLGNAMGGQVPNTGHQVKVTPIVAATGIDARGLGFPAYHTEDFSFTGRTPATNSAPSEVALCLSFKSVESPTVPPARRRGRIYFGPLSATGFEFTTNIPRPDTGIMNRLLRAAARLKGDALTAGMEWVIYSRPYEGRGVVSRPGHTRGDLPAIPARPGALYAVSSYWVDNSLDTMRSRGERATSRISL